MLYFAGIGIHGVRGMPKSTRNVLETADSIYLDVFTSPIPASEIDEIDGIARGTMSVAGRDIVEDGRAILDAAREGAAALVCYGDPFVATTHLELRTRAAAEGIPTASVHAASAVTAAPGICGLHHYKMGRIATIMSSESARTPCKVLYANLLAGDHTILLLEYDESREFMMEPAEGLRRLLDSREGDESHAISDSTFAIVASRIGRDDQVITAGTISEILESDAGKGPHSIIVPGRLHFTEADALKSIAVCKSAPQDNAPVSSARRMISKYTPAILDSIKKSTRGADIPRRAEILDNAARYVSDARYFLERGDADVAILCIGYADGLADALRIADGREPDGVPSEKPDTA